MELTLDNLKFLQDKISKKLLSLSEERIRYAEKMSNQYTISFSEMVYQTHTLKLEESLYADFLTKLKDIEVSMQLKYQEDAENLWSTFINDITTMTFRNKGTLNALETVKEIIPRCYIFFKEGD